MIVSGHVCLSRGQAARRAAEAGERGGGGGWKRGRKKKLNIRKLSLGLMILSSADYILWYLGRNPAHGDSAVIIDKFWGDKYINIFG